MADPPLLAALIEDFMRIHPTAIISPVAEIADDVQIGPYVCIDGHATIGPGCII